MDRQKLAERIQALLSKTVDRGCTEAEALAAAEKAQELLHLYQMSRSDLELEAEGMLHETITPRMMKDAKFRWIALKILCSGISKFTDCRGWGLDGGRGGYEFAGLRSDVEFAVWLTKALMDFAHQAYTHYQFDCMLDFERKDQNGFYIGLCERIKERMLQEVARRQAAVGTGRDLVVTKKPLIDDFVKSLGIHFTKGRALATASGSGAAAGRRYGDRAGFGRPVNSGAAVRRIGRN